VTIIEPIFRFDRAFLYRLEDERFVDVIFPMG
jgi:hypothetical protein